MSTPTGRNPVEDDEPEALSTPPPRNGRPRPRWALITVLAVSGLLGIATGGVAIGADLTRKPTANEIKLAGEKEIASRWRVLDAGEIFPARADMRAYTPVQRFPVPTSSALRMGIAPKTSCAAGFDRPLADVLSAYGCRTVLRATYVDGSHTLVTTLGIAVMPNANQATEAETAADASPAVRHHGVHAVAFPGTIAAGFDDSLRQDFVDETNGTPYLFFSSSGWITDRATPVKAVDNTFDFVRTALNKVELSFADTTAPCDRPGVRC